MTTWCNYTVIIFRWKYKLHLLSAPAAFRLLPFHTEGKKEANMITTLSVCLQFQFLNQLADSHETHVMNVMPLDVTPNAPHFNFRHSVITTWRVCELVRCQCYGNSVMLLQNGKITRRQPGKPFCSFRFDGDNKWTIWARHVTVYKEREHNNSNICYVRRRLQARVWGYIRQM